MQEETIYNLLVPEKITIPKQPKYQSTHTPYKLPTGSTFINKTCARPGVANLAGEANLGPETHLYKGAHSTFGKPKGTYRPKTTDFVKGGTGRMGSNALPDINAFAYRTMQRKEPIPKFEDKPVMGLTSEKNYVTSNIVENVTTAPKKLKETKNYIGKKDYGKVPAYLMERSNRIADEYEYLRHMQLADEDNKMASKQLMSLDEAQELRDALQKKWDFVNKQYQEIAHMKVDTIGQKRKKEDCEKQLERLEQDIKKLNKAYIFIDKLK